MLDQPCVGQRTLDLLRVLDLPDFYEALAGKMLRRIEPWGAVPSASGQAIG